MQSYHIVNNWGHRICSELRFKDDTILPCSWVPNSPDPFWTEVHGWYNPTTFSMTEVHRIHSRHMSQDDTITRSILNRGSWMIQSYHILYDRSHQIHSGHKSRDDTIPLHSQILRSSGHFWASSQGWYNPTATSLLPLSGKVFLNHTNIISKVFKLYSR